MTSITHKNSSHATISAETYVYDDAGNLTEKTVNGVTTTYTYDDAGRTTSVVTSAGTTSLTYDYRSEAKIPSR